MDIPNLTIGDVGEQGLLKRLQSFCPSEVVGDDAALVTVAPDHRLVVTTDVLVDGVHFSWGVAEPEVWTTSPYDAGWRAATANLSDIAAMGAHPLAITVGLSAPSGLFVADLERFYQGLRDCLAPYGVPIVGGDMCRSSVMTVAIAALGQVLPDRAIVRSAAQPGDLIVVTGYHGSSRAGLELLLHPDQGEALNKGDRQCLIRAHQRPSPRLDVIDCLNEVRHEVRHAGDQPLLRVAGMDSSDGLADAVLQLCRASGVGARLNRMAIPIAPALTRWRSPQEAMAWALYGGEDFELVLTCEEAIAQALVQRLGTHAAIIGEITDTSTVTLVDPSNTLADEVLQLEQGFQHF